MSIERREVLKSGLAVMAAGVIPGVGAAAAAAQAGAAGRKGFRQKYAPHFGMFKAHAGDDPIDQLKFMADEGFAALEDNGMSGRSVNEQEKIAAEMRRLGMTMGVFVANPGTAWECSFASGDRAMREKFLAECKAAVEVAKRVNARWMTVVPGTIDPRLEAGFQTANAVESLRRAAELFEPHNLVMVLEPLNPWRDHPNMLLAKIAHAYEICRAVNSPACKILFDMYHQQITEGNIIPNMDRAWDEVAYFQIGDNPGRNEPTTGELNYRNIFRHIHERGFTGVLGMEHGNSKPGKEGERAVIEAYRRCDEF